jgi:DNA gyrase/topoisomerase IV subunit B
MFDYELDYSGVLGAVLENAFDQASEHGGGLEVELNAEGWFRVRDQGEGLPVHSHPVSERPLIEVILMGPRRGPRNSLARVSSSCLWLEAEVLREGRRYRQRYEFAKPTGTLEDLGPAPGSGTALVMSPASGSAPSFPALIDQLRELGRDSPAPIHVEARGPGGELVELELGGHTNL